MFRPVFYLLVCIALWSASVISLSVFSDAPKAHMLLRSRRANSFLEEIKPPSMERECVEEKCDFEEAREIFQTREATLEFWTVYTDGNQCQSHKCDHGACMDLYQTYKCICYPGYEGKYCEYNITATNCTVDNGDCDHECMENEDGQGRSCSCLKGYNLENDSRKCSPKSTSSCGQILIHRSEYSEPVEGLLPWTLGGEVGKKGESPWQVLLLNEKGIFHCGGVLIDENWVLTAAHCLQNTFKFSVRLGDYERFRNEGTEVLLRVTKTFKHPKYNSMTEDNDIALLRLQSPAPLSKYIVPICLPGRSLAEKVLHLNGTTTVVTGWGKDDTGKLSSALNFIKVPLVNHSFCRQQMFPHDLTNNVLCAGILGERIDACEGDSGGPMVTLYRDTWFLIGLVSWGEGCGMVDKLGIYTKVSNYNEWISQVQEEWDRRHHPQ
ncbi:vitamin K-dependent protein C isoform X1 [Cyprinodon tularosa]|uniref:Vitamin K-dependent protein C n=1 Tax=Cyprinodon variegatus TaxID=28743 RepID=A0A3Q2DFD0_CYPVA|nr:PREDICTED: vitamin K-dependent protein C [Cyprinodon variegatus]XP_038125862.1 vitamin K-dependent protein C isoform X1 [Cyprinodon tularosa]XP_038125863.1 vitamin K-dependent protein C isoform X1 [Cyprinodon tularosa]XP_038125864.1 vitamin K-dependent protein C isoform X1 [Cyprinodon tularosa]